jgi:hypothetical protein
MRARQLAAGFAALMVCGTDTASAYISANTIDGLATYTRDGACAGDRPDRLHARRARRDHAVHHAGDNRSSSAHDVDGPPHGRGPALAGPGARARRNAFRAEAGPGLRPGATRAGGRVTETRHWCERGSVTARF